MSHGPQSPHPQNCRRPDSWLRIAGSELLGAKPLPQPRPPECTCVRDFSNRIVGTRCALCQLAAAAQATMGYLREYCREDSREGEPAEMTTEAKYQHGRLANALAALNGEG